MPLAVGVLLGVLLGALIFVGVAWFLAVLVLIVARLAYGRPGPPPGSMRRRVVEWCRVVRDLGDLFDLLNL